MKNVIAKHSYGYYEEDCSESYDYRESDVNSDDFVMSDVGTEMSEINHSNPMNIEDLERDFRKDIKMDCTLMDIYNLLFLSCLSMDVLPAIKQKYLGHPILMLIIASRIRIFFLISFLNSLSNASSFG